MNNQQIFETAKNQSAIDLNFHKADFDKDCNAIRSGFRPAWVEMTVKSKDLIDEMNR